MQRVNGHLFFSPSDLNHFVECEHLTTLDLRAVDGEGVAKEKDPQAEIMRAKGFEHEQACLQRLRDEGKQVVSIAADGEIDWLRDAERTERAMRDATEVIYQGVFVDAPWRGVADFLFRVDRPSRFGAWGYEAADAKLARHPKPYFILQLCWYSEQLERIQGSAPRRMHVILGSRDILDYAPSDFLAYYRAVRSRFQRALAQPAATPTYPSPVGHCHVCGYASHCETQRVDDDHLSLVAGIRRDQVERLNAVGISKVPELAVLDPVTHTGIMPQTVDRLTRQARLQVEARTAEHRYELLLPEAKRGFGLLPMPSDGDVFFDIEGYPYFDSSAGLEYLWGISTQDNAAWRFQSFECTDRAGEKRAFEQFIDFVQDRLKAYPDLHVYHYAPYETTAVTRLMGQHASREAEVDDLLRRGVFVDLYQVVRQAMQISYDSYSLKRVREFFMPDAGAGKVTGGGESILEFQRFLETGDTAILDAIRDYNAEDCESTRLLRDWLLARKAEAERQYGAEIPWYVKAAGAEKAPEERDENRELREALLASGDSVAMLLAHVLDYHQREAKPGWWAFFARLKKSLDELREDTEAIAYLTEIGAPIPDKKSLVHRLAFIEQEFKLKDGSAPCEPVEGKKAGEIVSIDLAGELLLRRGPSFAGQPIPSALVADGPVPTRAQQDSLARIGEAFVSAADIHRVGRDILARVASRFTRVATGAPIQTMALAEQVGLAASLDDSYLFIQGPPGSGKTYTGARLIAALVAEGRRVAVTATSHKAIHNLLDEVIVAASEWDRRASGAEQTRRSDPIAGLKKCSGGEETVYNGDGFTNTESNAECAASDASIVAGTSWLFARDEMADKFDYLCIDEAGQVSLADAVAMSPCARNIVLLGDPQQLPHVTQGIHPDRAGASVLEHLLNGEATVPPDRGLFLEETWRMHPGVCDFISDLAYEGRLRSEPGCARQRIDSAGLIGTGLRYVPVEHTGNAQQSQEEVEVIAAEVRRLLDTGTFTDRNDNRSRLTPSDILVVAPYNMQVRALLHALPAGVEAGTVDKFQGRQAPVVIFSMATSSGEDIPRGLDFLFSRNRLNVAISRAKALAVLVCSPRLLETRCRTVEQMRLVNGLCALVEHANASISAVA